MREHNRVIPREALRHFQVIWLTAVVKQSPIHWFGGLTRYVEELWRATNELRVGVLVMDRGGSDVTLDYARANSSRLEQTRVCSSVLKNAKTARAGGQVRSSPRA